MAVMATLKQEFRCSSFKLGGTNPHLFAEPQIKWLGMPWTFITYRLAMAIYQVIFMTLVIVYWGVAPFYNPVDTRAKWFIYVSDWTYTIITIYLTMAAITTIYWQLTHRNKKSGKETSEANGDIELNANNPQAKSEGNDEVDAQVPSTPWYFQVQRFFHVYACAASLLVTILYWALEYSPDTSIVSVFGVHVHGVGSAMMILDTMLIATPFRILHLVYVMIIAATYFCFTAIYWAAGGLNPSGETHIYSGIIDWEEDSGLSAGVSIGVVLVATPVLHLIFYALYQLRLAFGRCCSCCMPNVRAS